MLCMDNQTAIQQHRFLTGKHTVRTDQAENIFRCGIVAVRHMQEHGCIVKIPALGLIGMGNDNREFGNQIDRLTDNIFQTGIIRIGVIGI